jgi:hypothetical protein
MTTDIHIPVLSSFMAVASSRVETAYLSRGPEFLSILNNIPKIEVETIEIYGRSVKTLMVKISTNISKRNN